MNELERFQLSDDGGDEGYTTILVGAQHPDFAAFQPGAGVPMGYDDLRVLEARNFLAAVRDGEQREPGRGGDGRHRARARRDRALGRERRMGGRRDEPVANAPLSYGAFEMTVGTDFAVPEPTAVLEAIAAAGYAGTDLGPPGYLGEGDVLRERLEANGLEVVGGFVPMRFSEAEGFEEDVPALHHTLDLFDAAGATGARPVLCDAGGPERIANPGRGGEEPELRLGDAPLAHARRQRRARRRRRPRARLRAGLPPPHVDLRRGRAGDRALPRRTPTCRCCSTPGTCSWPEGIRWRRSRDWGERIGAVHIKDVRLGVLEGVKAERADTLTAWRRGLFCALGQGDVDLDGFCAALTERGYDGWVVVEQDRVLDDAGDFAVAGDEQIANREWLKEHAGW